MRIGGDVVELLSRAATDGELKKGRSFVAMRDDPGFGRARIQITERGKAYSLAATS